MRILRIAAKERNELLKAAISKYGMDAKMIQQEYFKDSKLQTVENQLSLFISKIPKKSWTIEEDLVLLNHMKLKNLTSVLVSHDLVPKLQRSCTSIAGRSYNLSLCVIAEQLKLSHEEKDSSIPAAVDSLISQISTQKTVSSLLRRNKIYLQLLHNGIKKHGLRSDKIQAEFLPMFTLSAIMLDLNAFDVPNRKITDCQDNIEIFKHIDKFGFSNWEDLASRLALSTKQLYKKWYKIQNIYEKGDGARFLENELEILERLQVKKVWSTKHTNTLQLGLDLFGSDVAQIQQKLLPGWDLEFLELKLKDSTFFSKKRVFSLKSPYLLRPTPQNCLSEKRNSRIKKIRSSKANKKLDALLLTIEAETELTQIAKSEGLDYETVLLRWKKIRKKHNLPKRNEAEQKLDHILMNIHANKGIFLSRVAIDLGIDYKSVLSRWAYLRRIHHLPVLKKRSPGKPFGAIDVELADKWILEHATHSDKSLKSLSNEKGLALPALYRRWNILKKKYNLASTQRKTEQLKPRPLSDEEFVRLPELDREIIKRGTSSDQSINSLVRETGNKTSFIFGRWKKLKQTYQLISTKKSRRRKSAVLK
jgi:hypothetical protein